MRIGKLILVAAVSFIPMVPLVPDILRLITSEQKTFEVSAVTVSEFTPHRRTTPELKIRILTGQSSGSGSKECRLYLFSGNVINKSSTGNLGWLLERKTPFKVNGQESIFPDHQCWMRSDVSYIYWWLFICMLVCLCVGASFYREKL